MWLAPRSILKRNACRSPQDLDSFLTWLVQTQTAAAADELPNTLEEAERLINCHAALKEEIGRYEEDYERLQAVNELLEAEEAPLPYAALQQWLQKLDVGWNKLLEMWESRREVLVQAHIFHLFMRDVKQAEAFLNNQVRDLTARETYSFNNQFIYQALLYVNIYPSNVSTHKTIIYQYKSIIS